MPGRFPYAGKVEPLTFEITWLDREGKPSGRDEIRKIDLSAAITYACNALKASMPGFARDAHGFFVQAKREEN